jgi:hypothetical protein
MHIDPDRYYTRRELAAIPGMPTAQTLACYVTRGGGITFTRVSRTGKGGRVIYLGADVIAWLNSRRVVQAQPEGTQVAQ